LVSFTPTNGDSDRAWLAFFRDLYLGFGPPDQLLLRCVQRAYRDFNRTWLIGPGQSHQRPAVRAACDFALVTALSALDDEHAGLDAYDNWHSQLMAALMQTSDPLTDNRGLTLGQAQKWINMSVKYAIGGRLPGFERFERCAHMPIDRILLKELTAQPKFRAAVDLLPIGPWSRLADGAAYSAFQREVRALAVPDAPLMLELGLWMRAQGKSLA
jgi:hypothetical protein